MLVLNFTIGISYIIFRFPFLVSVNSPWFHCSGQRHALSRNRREEQLIHMNWKKMLLQKWQTLTNYDNHLNKIVGSDRISEITTDKKTTNWFLSRINLSRVDWVLSPCHNRYCHLSLFYGSMLGNRDHWAYIFEFIVLFYESFLHTVWSNMNDS